MELKHSAAGEGQKAGGPGWGEQTFHEQLWQEGENAKNREFTTAERIASEAFSAAESAKDREQSQKQFEQQMAFNREQFNYNQKSDEAKLAWNYMEQILAGGGDPSAELLAKAGLSWADWQSMKVNMQNAAASSGSPSGNPAPTNPGTTPGTTSEEEFLRQFENGFSNRNGSMVGTTTPDKNGRTTTVVYTPDKIAGKDVPKNQVTWKKTLTK